MNSLRTPIVCRFLKKIEKDGKASAKQSFSRTLHDHIFDVNLPLERHLKVHWICKHRKGFSLPDYNHVDENKSLEEH